MRSISAQRSLRLELTESEARALSAPLGLSLRSVRELGPAWRPVHIRSHGPTLCDPHLLTKHLQFEEPVLQLSGQRPDILSNC